MKCFNAIKKINEKSKNVGINKTYIFPSLFKILFSYVFFCLYFHIHFIILHIYLIIQVHIHLSKYFFTHLFIYPLPLQLPDVKKSDLEMWK